MRKDIDHLGCGLVGHLKFARLVKGFLCYYRNLRIAIEVRRGALLMREIENRINDAAEGRELVGDENSDAIDVRSGNPN